MLLCYNGKKCRFMGGESKSMESCIRVFIADSTRDGADLLRRALEPPNP